MSSRYIMVIDATHCMNCKACIMACQQRNHVPYAFDRNWVIETMDDESPCGMVFQPGACMHCDNPVCVYACPTGATFKASDASVVVNRDICIGCGGCVDACPYNARFIHPQTGKADKCDYCRANAIDGLPPACVAVCPTECRIFGDANDSGSPVAALLTRKKQVHVIPASVNTKPTLTYLGTTQPVTFPEGEKAARTPTPLAMLPAISKAVTVLGGISLFGVIGVFLKQLFWPSDGHNDRGA